MNINAVIVVIVPSSHYRTKFTAVFGYRNLDIFSIEVCFCNGKFYFNITVKIMNIAKCILCSRIRLCAGIFYRHCRADCIHDKHIAIVRCRSAVASFVVHGKRDIAAVLLRL